MGQRWNRISEDSTYGMCWVWVQRSRSGVKSMKWASERQVPSGPVCVSWFGRAVTEHPSLKCLPL